MSARYFVPDHPSLTDVYGKEELRALVQTGKLSRSEIVCDDDTGKAHLLGDLLAAPHLDVISAPPEGHERPAVRSVAPQEFRAPLAKTPERNSDDDDDDDKDEGNWKRSPIGDVDEEEEDDSELDNENAHEVHAQSGRLLSETDDDDDSEHIESLAGQQDPREYREVRADPFAPPAPEQWLYLGHPSWLAFPRCILFSLACFAAAVQFWRENFGLEWITLSGSIGGLIILYISLQRSTTAYMVTTRRVEMEYGIIGRSTREVRICDIRAIDVQQVGYQALVGIGSVNFDSSASAGAEIKFQHVRKPHAIKEMVRELQG